jgi:hypothetical protein
MQDHRSIPLEVLRDFARSQPELTSIRRGPWRFRCLPRSGTPWEYPQPRRTPPTSLFKAFSQTSSPECDAGEAQPGDRAEHSLA